jgi:tripartite-type tricarboxylate transporter receptor subunit TctC
MARRSASRCSRTSAFDPLKDFQPVSSLAYFDFVLFTNAGSPYKTLADVVAAGKTKPGGVNVGTVSVGSSQNLSAELLKATAGLDATIVPFRRTPDILVALLRNDVDVMVDTYAAAKSAVDDKQVRAIATSGTARSPLLPDVPTVRESGAPEFEVTSWNGLFVPAKTPPAVVETLNKALREVLGSADIKNRFLELGVEARATSPRTLGTAEKRHRKMGGCDQTRPHRAAVAPCPNGSTAKSARGSGKAASRTIRFCAARDATATT